MNWIRRHVRPEQVRELSLLLLIVLAVIFFGSLISNYYTSRTFNRIAASVTIITIVAGQSICGDLIGSEDDQRRHTIGPPGWNGWILSGNVFGPCKE